MHPALLAAYAVCNVTLFLPPQSSLPDVAWPTHAVVAVPQGWVKPDDKLFVIENDRPMQAQVEVAARWPDHSPKWLHAYGLFRYQGGQPAQYALVRQAELPADVPGAPLVVSDDKEGIRIDTGVIKLTIPRPFRGITMLTHRGQTVINGDGGPSVIDGDGVEWHARHDPKAEIAIESQGPAMVTVKAHGWYQTPTERESFCRFTTRITAFAGSSIVKIDHATTFADNMKDRRVAELAFKFALPEATAFSSSTLRGSFSEKLLAVFLAQLTDDKLWRIAQTGEDANRDIRSRGDYERSAGWFSAQVGDARVALLTKDFWEKCPKEVKISPQELVYYAWPKHGELAPEDPEETLPQHVYKFRCFHRGDMLDSRLPAKYFEALSNQKDTSECKPEFARAANMQGVSMRNQFALAIVGDAADAKRADEYLEKLQQVFLQNPAARASPTAIAASGALGPVAAAGDDFAEMDKTAVDGVLGYSRSIQRYGDYGWAIYGNTHHEELMNPAAAGVPGGRPSLHRVWNNNHYRHVSTAWRLWATSGDWRLLDWARTCTDNYASIGQVRYDKTWYRTPPGPQRRPSVKYHHPGGFYHCKGLVPWGGRDYGMGGDDVDAALTGHWPDPTALLLAWQLGADRWAKDGYDLWYSEVKLPTGGGAREANQTLVHAINAYEYRPSLEIADSIHSVAKGLTNRPLLSHRPGALWDPTWLSRYYELEPTDEAFKQFLLESADAVGCRDEGFWTMALSATAYEITGDPKYLLRHAGSLDRLRRGLFQDPTGRWQDYGHMPGPSLDSQFAMQWPRFLAALRKAGFKNLADLKPPFEPGHYLSSTSRYNNDADVDARGTRILILHEKTSDQKTSDASQPSLVIEGSVVSGGDIQATSMKLLDPAGTTLWKEPRIRMSSPGPANHVERLSSWAAVREIGALGDRAGIYTLLAGSHEIGIFQPVAPGLPECQVLQNAKIPNWSEPVRYRCKLSKGWLVPLTAAPIKLVFQAIGDRHGSHVTIVPSRGEKWERWLVAGQKAEIDLAPGAGPWALDIFGDSFSSTQVEIHSSVSVPLLYGFDLAAIRAIMKKLGR